MVAPKPRYYLPVDWETTRLYASRQLAGLEVPAIDEGESDAQFEEALSAMQEAVKTLPQEFPEYCNG